MGKMLTCPECKRKIQQVGKEQIYCNGRRTPTSVAHKKIVEMK